MAKKSVSYKKRLYERLREPERASGILTEALKDEDPKVGLLALRDVVEANGGMTKISKLSKLSRVHLYEMLSEKGNPEYRSLGALLKSMGFSLAVAVKPQKPKRAIRKKKAVSPS